LELGDVVCVRGVAKLHNEEVELNVSTLSRERDANAESLFWLECAERN
jgi:hypothetical protein